MKQITAIIDNANQVLTCAKDADDHVGAQSNVAVAIANDQIAMVPASNEIEAKYDLTDVTRIDAKGGLVIVLA